MGTRTDIIQAFPEYEYVDGKNMFRGIDVSRGGYVYGEPGIYNNVGLLDSASHHPSSIIAMNVFGDYTQRFKELLEARIAIKHRDFDTARSMLDGRLAPFLDDPTTADDLANALKTAINSVYGLTSASFPNPFKDPRNVNNIVACRGAIFMKLLQDEVEARGYKVPSVRTDSLKIVGIDDDIISFVIDFGRKYGYEFEHEATYEKMCLTTKADYVAKYDDKGIRNKGGKHAGEWTSTGAYFSRPYVFKTLFSKEEIEFKDICETKEVKSTDGMWLDMNEDLPEGEHKLVFIGRVGLFCPIKKGSNGGELVVKRNDRYDAVSGTKGYRWLEAEEVKVLSKEGDIDMEYYHSMVNDAKDTINKFGDFEQFSD